MSNNSILSCLMSWSFSSSDCPVSLSLSLSHNASHKSLSLSKDELISYIQQHPSNYDIYNNILTYQAIDMEELYTRLHQDRYKVTKLQLKEILQSLNVFVKGSWGKRSIETERDCKEKESEEFEERENV
mmetsp:Transcript_14387/g.14494  ORF Transcript_14387/g.14494 Transcript_14387/m.14494 type:complete len:129 (+) Transcript_14387:378-764(+)